MSEEIEKKEEASKHYTSDEIKVLKGLEPVRESSVLAWSSAEGLGGPLDEEEKRARLERTVADYQLAGDLFARGGLKEEEVLR